MFNPKTSIFGALILPVPIIVGLAILFSWIFIPNLTEDSAREDALNSSTEMIAQFRILRGYYTKNVIKKVLENSDIKPSTDHANRQNSIPLPATLIHDMSELLKNQNTTISLYSAYPFPNRASRKLDDFQQQAWNFLQQNPEKIFSREETINGDRILRVASADTMSAQGCVNCHNSRPDTPKNDWELGDVRGVLEVSKNIESQLVAGHQIGNIIILILFVSGILLIAIFIFISGKISKKISGIIDTMSALSDNTNDIASIEIPGMERKDEIGRIARALQVFKNSAAEMNELEAVKAQLQKTANDKQVESEERQKQQVLDRRKEREEAELEKKNALNELVSTFESSVGVIVDDVSAAATEMQSTAKKMGTISQQTTSQAATVSEASANATSNVESVAAAAEELSASIREISNQISQSTLITNQAVEEAQKANVLIEGLNSGAQKIDEVVRLIQDIAEQTNLLALNATIEAARAGDAGKGFAVVASEVKNLASQTAKATEQISAQISEVQESTHTAVAAIQGISKTITKVDAVTAAIAAAVEEQGAATQEISSSIQKAATGTQKVSSSITSITASASESENALNAVLDASQKLSQQAMNLRKQVSTFVDDAQSR